MSSNISLFNLAWVIIGMSLGMTVGMLKRIHETDSKLTELKTEVLRLADSVSAHLDTENPTAPAIVYKTVCSTSTFKSWMDYRAITSKASKQYQLQLKATTDSFYGFRKIGDYIMVAMGPQYGPVGTKYVVQFEDKKVLQIIIGDIKHLGCQSSDSSMVEFIVDSSVIPNSIKSSGNFNSVFSGSITVIQEVLT